MGFAAATSFASAQSYPDEYLGLPGDNLNLYAVMNLFQESETLEGFERKLNDQESMINNLDLNGDGLIDYITVSDYPEGNVHTIVLRAALGRNEQQDVAVFVVEELRNGAVEIQLIGDEALYGPNYIVEPIYAETPNPGYTGKVYRNNVNYVTTTYYDIAAWPVIRFMFHPAYVVWRSSWYWGYYPSYWRPWRAHYWHYYYGYHYHWHNHYYSHYRHWNHYRCRHYHNHYYSHVRVHSPAVVVNIQKDRYRTTYSRPDQRRAGEDYYTRTASRRNPSGGTVTATNRQTVQRSANQAARTDARMSTSGRSMQRSTPNVQRSGNSRTTPSVQRSTSNSSRNNATVQRGTSQRSTPSVQRSTSNSSRTAPTVQRSTSSSSRSTPSVQRSTSSSSRSNATVQRSTSQRSTPSVQRSSGNRSTPTVQRSSSSRSKSSSVQRSSSQRSTPTVHHSSGSSKRSNATVQRSGSSKSSAQRSSSRQGSRSSQR